MIIGVDGNEANVSRRVGTGQYTLSLLKEWQKTASPVVRFLIYLSSPPNPWMPPKTSYFSYLVFKPKKFWTQLALPVKLFLQKEKPNVFFSPAHYLPRLTPPKVKKVVTIHDLAYYYYPQEFKRNDLWQLKNWTRYSVRKADQIIAVSENTKKDIVKFYHLSRSKISIVYNGYDTNRFYHPIPLSRIKKVKRKYHLKENEDYVIYLGTLQPRKNIENLIKAIPQVSQRFNKLKWVIAGKKGWLYQSIFSLAKKLNIEKKLIFTDFVPDEEIPSLLAGAKLFVLPSFYEGFGITAIEAMACGTPVLVSHNSSLPEVVGRAGKYIENPQNYSEIAQKIEEILSDENLRKKLISKGLERVKKFSWQKCAQETLEVLLRTAK